ncbi:alanyl-tRNA editing protein Aarsd1 isoform X3 [Lepisosteus oculatus]|uniref:alanyl-tRNA editing protein Aarsd1 isoform X3 n=1 Tax=Lepisosteus oculatus TaxID=7918 RepID=UPI003722C1C5
MSKITRPENSQPARAIWFDRAKYLFINFLVEDSKDVQVDIQENKMIFRCKSGDDTDLYNEIYFYDRIQPKDSRERKYDRTINVMLRKIKEGVAWPRLTKDSGKPSWLSVDFDNWRDWEKEEEEGMAEYEKYIDMIRGMSKGGPPPAMDDLDDLDFTTTVVSCRPAELKLDNSGKKETVKGFNVTLEDTVLFPEGGGQPDDRGLIGGVPVLRVTRQGAEAVHFVASPLEEGSSVRLKLDWDRRFDHMQQHSGQHLITAIADSMFGYKTTSWELGRQRSVIELDTAAMKPGEAQALEKAVNEKIRACVPVTVQLLSPDDPAVEKVRSRGLPEDHAGPVRIIDIEGIDANMCCGTHVSNLSHLQVIKILGTEKGKKNKTNVIFLAGDRVLKYADRSYNTERALTSLLKTGAEEHVEAVDKLQKSVKLLQKNNLNLLRDLAVLTAQNFKSNPNRGKLFCLHRKDGDNEFMNIIANEIGTEDTLLFLTVGEEKGAGLFLLAGPAETVDSLGPRVAETLDGKGAGKRGRYQGKASRMAQRGEAELLLLEYLKHCSSEEE